MEMNALCKGNVHAETGKAVIEGAMLVLWHVMLVLQASMKKLGPYMSSLDMREAEKAKMVYLNFQALQDNISMLMADPSKLNAALDNATAFVLSMQQQQAAAQAAPAETAPPPPSAPSLITLTDQ